MAVRGNVNGAIQEELRCPVCKDYCTPPIIQCLNGHNMCSKCRAKKPVCSVCNAKLSVVRNRLAEQLAAQMHACTNGCEARLLLKDMAQHVSGCTHGITKCLIHVLPSGATVFSQCVWKGLASELLAHVKKSHPGCWSNNDNTRTVSYKLRKQHIFLLAAYDLLFWSLLKFDFTTSDMRGSVFSVSNIKPPSKFAFQYQFVSEDRMLDICKKGAIGDPGTFYTHYNSTIFQGKRMMDQLVKDNKIKFKVSIFMKES